MHAARRGMVRPPAGSDRSESLEETRKRRRRRRRFTHAGRRACARTGGWTVWWSDGTHARTWLTEEFTIGSAIGFGFGLGCARICNDESTYA